MFTAVNSFVVTLTAALCLRAEDSTLAVASVACVVVLLTWFAQLHADDATSGLATVSPAWALALAVAGRQPWSGVLPLFAAHAVGAAVAGGVALALDRWLGAAQVGVEPHWLIAVSGGILVGVLGTWAAFAIDGQGTVALAGVPVLVGGAALPVAFAALVNPAAALGVAVTGMLGWGVALAACGACLIGAAVGAYAVSVLLPRD